MASIENNPEAERVNRPACAACKHQRKKCKLRKCILHEIFPASEHEEFQAVHKIFGISNVTKLMHELTSSEDRIRASRALKYEAMLWKRDPIQGALGEISRLRRELEMVKNEYRRLWNLMESRTIQHLPLPPHHRHHHDHMLVSSSSVGFGNTQQSNVKVIGNNVQVFQNSGVLATNGEIGLDRGGATWGHVGSHDPSRI